MILSCRILDNVVDVNDYDIVPQFEATQGDTNTVYIQLVDSASNKASAGFNPPGKRYIPAVGSTLTVLANSLDDAKKVTRIATQPFPLDGSIWSFQILGTDPIVGTCNLKLTLNETGVMLRGVAPMVISISGQ